MADTPKSFQLSPEIHRYLVEHGTPPDRVQRALIEETERLGPVAIMQIAPEQGALLTMLVRLLGARRAVEVGTFTGYSTLCIARGLAEGGTVVACDLSEEWTAIGRRHWEAAGVTDRIDLRIGPAADTLAGLGSDPPLDFAFIDADKTGYATYLERILERMRPGGLVAVDNVLWGGAVVDPAADDESTKAIRAFNDAVRDDPRVDCVMLPVADGLTLLRKR